VAVRSSSAFGKDENFLASDVSAIVAYTRDAVYLNDFDLVALERDKFEISSLAGERGDRAISKVEFTGRGHQERRLSALHAQGNL
jgi:glucosamine 6-phosphate synthetase-like amidotransferase/phosphosugar isomerase protein